MPFPIRRSSDVVLALAPMEGVMDQAFRQILTALGGIDFCVSEFIRVTTSLHAKTLFQRFVPELPNSLTPSGHPVVVQLLGGQPEPLALNAARAFEMGSPGVDLNFGCPAKTVNRHDGGASLLQYPRRIENLVKSVVQITPPGKFTSVKMRLGFNDSSLLQETALAVQEAGASWITLHCRTKSQGYKPPAHWEEAARLIETLQIPLIVNGDIFTVDDFKRCKEITAAKNFMIGRGALKNPLLFSQIRQFLTGKELSTPTWDSLFSLVIELYKLEELCINKAFAAARTKQWLRFLCLTWPEAQELFGQVKALRNEEFFNSLFDPKNLPFKRELVLNNGPINSKMREHVRINHYFS